MATLNDDVRSSEPGSCYGSFLAFEDPFSIKVAVGGPRYTIHLDDGVARRRQSDQGRPDWWRRLNEGGECHISCDLTSGGGGVARAIEKEVAGFFREKWDGGTMRLTWLYDQGQRRPKALPVPQQ